MNDKNKYLEIKAGILILIACAIMVVHFPAIACGQQTAAEVKKTAEPEKEAPIADPLGRDTPQGTLIGFMKDAGSGNYRRAAEYLDTNLPPKSAEQMIIQLYTVLNYGLSAEMQLSNKPEGDLSDDVDRSVEQVGKVKAGSRMFTITLERVQKGKDPPVWLFSSQTLKQVPEMYRSVRSRAIDKYIPEVLRETKLLNYPVWQWMIFILVIPLSLAFAWLVAWAFMACTLTAHRRSRAGREGAEVALQKGPLRVLALSLAFYIASFLSYTLLARLFWVRVSQTLLVMGMTWLCLYLIDPIVRRVFGHRELKSSGTIAVSRLLHQTLKTIIILIGALLIFYMAGVNVTAVLTGLGIGGIAIAFAAQKTLENFFGGIMIVWDQPIRVGDFCRCDKFMGTVEDIGLRSMRLRTLDRTVVAIPNGQLAMMSIENFSVRDKVLFHQKILLRYETSRDQIRGIIHLAQHLIDSDRRLEKGGWVRFTGFREAGLEIEIWAYFQSTDYGGFQMAQEELLLKLMKIIEEAGSALSVPSRITYVVDSSHMVRNRIEEEQDRPGVIGGQDELPFDRPSSPDVPDPTPKL